MATRDTRHERPDHAVTCPKCDGEGGAYGLEATASSTAQSPDEGYHPCPRCDDRGWVGVDELTDADWRRL